MIFAKRCAYRAAVGKTRRGNSASPAVTNTISPPINWNITIVRQVLYQLSVDRGHEKYLLNPPNSHNSTSSARYGNCITTFEEAGGIIARAHCEIYHPSEKDLGGIVHWLTTMNWLWASCDDKQVVIYAYWRPPTPRFDRNHNDTGQKNQENLEPFERPL